jgi:hypothetical protein
MTSRYWPISLVLHALRRPRPSPPLLAGACGNHEDPPRVGGAVFRPAGVLLSDYLQTGRR